MIQDLHRVIRLIEGDWKSKHILVVGDVMLDRYIWGDVKRISPEAPVAVVSAVHRNDRAGGAGNVAANIAGLGARSTLVGFIGSDEEGHLLRGCLATTGVSDRLLTVSSHPTTSKMRILGGNQQMLRLDVEQTSPFVEEAYLQLLQAVGEVMSQVDAVILSDYAKGVFTESVCQSIITMANKAGVPVLVDPKQRSFARYRGATTICPNLHEIVLATATAGESIEQSLAAAQGLVEELGLSYLTVTLGEKGIAVLRKESREIYPAVARQVFDVSGAGDTVIATLSMSLASGLGVSTAMQLANIAAGVVVSKVGTVPITSNDLLASLMPEIGLNTDEKVVDLDDLLKRISAWKSRKERIVFTNGCFDLLHVGHISLLQQARREGDRLIVAINSDASVSGLKGPTRPIVGEQERAYVLAALGVVDAVIIFGEKTPLELITALHPDVIVKGGDYTEDTVVGAQEVRSWGGRVKIVPTLEGFSTSRLIERATTPAV